MTYAFPLAAAWLAGAAAVHAVLSAAVKHDPYFARRVGVARRFGAVVFWPVMLPAGLVTNSVLNLVDRCRRGRA